MSVAGGFYESVTTGFERFEQSLNGERDLPFHQVRRAALDSFQNLGFPSRRDEDWRYTNLDPLTKLGLRFWDEPAPTISTAELNPHLLPDTAGLLVFVNGCLAEEHSRLGKLAGVRVRSLAGVLRSEGDPDRELAAAHLAKYAAYADQAVVALNTAFMRDGALIVIEGGAELKQPLQLLFYSSGRESGATSFSRVLVVAESGSNASIVESYAGADAGAYLNGAVTEVVVGENAHLDHYRILREAPSAYHVSALQADLSRSSTFHSSVYNFGGALVRNDVRVKLDGEGVHSGLFGLSILDGDQHVDNHTVLDHAKPNCTSDELYKGVYAGKSNGVFNGTIIVRPDAQKTNAIQSNQSILLSDTAASNSKPQLKIWADDVKCTHGATVGQLDEEALFYLRARGIPYRQSRRMLLDAFASEVLGRVRVAPLAAVLQELLHQRLAGLAA